MPPTKSDHHARSRLQLSATQLAASALAAVTATIAASFLGTNGTVIGAAIAAVVTVTGNAVYSHSIHRTRERVRSVGGRGPRDDVPPTTPVPAGSKPRRTRTIEPRTVRRLGLAAVGLFAATLAILTGIEVVAGGPVSALVRGNSASGTTVFGSQPQNTTTTTTTTNPTGTVTQTVVPKVVTSTPTTTRTAAPVTVMPTATTPATLRTTTRTATSTPTPSATPTTSTAPSSPASTSGTPTP
ncbi:MAG: putative secreted protein [Pseudonocardiales bacterium]|nr:putative secreted protein [Pseudonocardiales bacterium]